MTEAIVIAGLFGLVLAHSGYLGVAAASELARGGGETRRAGTVADLYAGVVIVVTCSTCLLPQALFVMSVWDEAAGPAIAVLLASLAIALVVGRRVPEGYFVVRPFERNGRLYRRLGVRAFKRVVPDGDLISRVARRRAGDREPGMGLNRTALSALDTRGRIAERAHLISLIAALPLSALAAVLDRPGFAIVLLVPNLIFHGYPVLLQRYTRARLHAIGGGAVQPLRRVDASRDF